MTNNAPGSTPLKTAAPISTKPRAAVSLGTRDMTLLCDLLTHGAMLAEHIHALYFLGRSRRRMNQRLRQLLDAKLIARRPLPLGLSGHLPFPAPGGIPWVFSLGNAGAPVVAAHLGWDLAEVRRLTRLGTPTAAAHTLEIVGLRLRAEEAVREWKLADSSIARLQFLPERLLRHGYQVRAPGGAWQKEVYKPDALLRIAFGDSAWRHYFAEIDLGHTSSREWETKAAIAIRYWKTGLFEKRYGAEDFLTLVCTTGERRRMQLCRTLVSRLGAEGAARFGLTTFAEVSSGLLSPIWHVPGLPHAVRLENWLPMSLATGGTSGRQPCDCV